MTQQLDSTVGTSAAKPQALADPARLEALRQTALLDAPTEQAFDRLSRLAARVLRTPTALVTLVDADRQVFRGCVGLPEPWATIRETPLSHSFCQHVVTTGKPLVVEDARTSPLLRGNLAIRDLNVVAYLGVPLATRDGHVLGAFCVIDDHPRAWTPDELDLLTELGASVMVEIELRATTREARRQALQLRMTFDAITDAVFIYDSAGRIIQANPAAYTLLGAPLGAEHADASPIDRARRYALRDPNGRLLAEDEWPVNQVLAGETLSAATVGDVLMTNLAGKDIRVSFTGGPLRDADGEMHGAVLVVRDLTERRQLEHEREQMLHIVSHELKTPLTSMKARTQVMQRRMARGIPLDASHLEILGQDIGRMERLVNDLVDASRLDTGNLRLAEEDVELAALVRQAVENEITATGRPIQLEVPRAAVWVHADPQRIYQVLTNFLSNALKYSPAEAQVAVRLEAGDGTARVSVRDEGPGIPREVQPRIFERFYRVPGIEARSGSGVGLGLGLYLCRRLVERHGGTVGVASAPGQGSTFAFTLPLVEHDAHEAPDSGVGEA